jgi:flagellar basal-body rod protein FlgB
MSTDNTIDAVRLALNLQDVRARVAGMNVANANRPDAAALRVDFAKVELALREAAHAGNEVEVSRWLAAAGQELGRVEPEAGGEPIRLDQEIGEIAAAGVEYQALTEALNRQFGLMRIAIAGRI